MILSSDVEKEFDKIQQPFMIKTLGKIGPLLAHNMIIYIKNPKESIFKKPETNPPITNEFINIARYKLYF